MKDISNTKSYIDFLVTIKNRILNSQFDALKKVNKELITLYLDIGQMIVLRQKENNWGKAIVETLSNDLQNEFPGIKGFSARNLWLMRTFYLEYKNNSKLQPLVAEIAWSHNIVLIQKVKNLDVREFYIKMTKRFGWTKNVLIHQIENQSFEKYQLNQTNFDKAVPEKYKKQAKLAVKDEYTFDFVELSDEHSEKELEIALINNVRKFLSEMGNHYSFIGNQYRMEIEGDEFFIDLLLYHRALKSLVAIELKIGDFKPEYAGKMQFYLSALNNTVKLKNENPSIGIIICKSKKRTIVEYALQDANKPIGVASYRISKKLPNELKNYLPSSLDWENQFKTIIDNKEENKN